MRNILNFFLIICLQLFMVIDSQAKNLAIVSYNVLFENLTGIYRYPNIIDFLKNAKADVICLQEVTPKFYQYLLDSQEIKNQYSIFPNTSPVHYGNIILSKVNVINSKIISIPTQMDRNVPFVDIEFEGKVIRVMNVHLESLDEPASIELRQKQLEKLESSIVKNTLVIGDFNFGDKDSDFDISDILLGLIDLTKPKTNVMPQVTYNPEENLLAKFFRSKGEPARRLDKVWSSPSISLAKYEIVKLPFSDHYPVVANLTLKN